MVALGVGKEALHFSHGVIISKQNDVSSLCVFGKLLLGCIPMLRKTDITK